MARYCRVEVYRFEDVEDLAEFGSDGSEATKIAFDSSRRFKQGFIAPAQPMKETTERFALTSALWCVCLRPLVQDALLDEFGALGRAERALSATKPQEIFDLGLGRSIDLITKEEAELPTLGLDQVPQVSMECLVPINVSLIDHGTLPSARAERPPPTGRRSPRHAGGCDISRQLPRLNPYSTGEGTGRTAAHNLPTKGPLSGGSDGLEARKCPDWRRGWDSNPRNPGGFT